MDVKSVSDCLNRLDNMIFDRSLKYRVKKHLELIGNHIEWQQADVVDRGEYIEERVAVLSVLSLKNSIIEIYYSDATEEDLDEKYNELRQRILEWYEVINTKPENNDQK